MTTATETKPAATENGTLTRADKLRRGVAHELSCAMADLKEQEDVWNDLKADTKAAKADYDAAQRKVNRLAEDLRDIERGQYQRKLLDPPAESGKAAEAEKPAPLFDEGAALTIDKLRDFSLTDKQVDLLQQSRQDLKTIGDIERLMREDPLWLQKIEGFGPRGIDRLSDALVELRKTYPVPVPPEADDAPAEASDAPQTTGGDQPATDSTVPSDVP